MEFRILGPLEVIDGGAALDLGRRKQRALLALLLLRAGQAVPVDRLVEELWRGRPPAQALASLQAYVSNLRRILEPQRRPGEPPLVLVRRPDGYVVQLEPSALDAARFEAGIARGRHAAEAGDHAAAERLFDEALALWRGEPLAEFLDEIERVPEPARLAELRLSAVEERTAAALALGRHATVVADLEGYVREHPLRERPRAQLALALYRGGRHAEALERLREARVLLSEELGLAPGPELRRLEQQILQHDPELAWTPPPASPPLAAEHAQPSATRASAPERALVGRETELAIVLESWSAAAGGQGGIVLVSGEAGTGKTRLVEELAARLVAEGARAWWGRAFEGGGAPAFWPWIQVLEAAVEELADDALRLALGAGASELVRLVPTLGERLEREAEPVGDAAEARFRLYDAVARFLQRLAAERPLAVVLDDLHWADAPSLELLRLVAGRVRATSLLLVATYRDTAADQSTALRKALAGLGREARVARVELRGLTVDEVAQLLAQELAATPPNELAKTLQARTDGNPFYLSELVRLVQARPEAATRVWEKIPTGIRDVVERRLAELPADAVRTLEAAAVIGREFALATTADASSLATDELLELLEPALAARIVVPSESSSHNFRFAHELVRETVYGRLTAARRLRLHAAAAEAIADRTPARLSELAFHYEQAAPLGYAERAVDAALAAARAAERVLAFEQAEEHLRQALRVVERSGDPGRQECRVQARLTGLLLMTSGYSSPAFGAAAARVRELAATDGSDPELAGVLWSLWIHHCVRGEFSTALELAHELSERGRSLPDTAANAAGLQARGTTLFYLGQLEEASECLEEAITLLDELDSETLEQAGLPHMAIQARCQTCQPFVLLDRADEAEAHVRKALRFAADRDAYPFDEATALMSLGWLTAARGDHLRALPLLEQAVELCEVHGFPQLGALGGVQLGWSRALSGNPTAGVPTIEAALAAIEDAGARLQRHWHLVLLAEALIADGREDEALAALKRADAASQETGEVSYRAEQLRLQGELLLARRERQAGLAALEQAAATAKHQGAVRLQHRAEASLATAASAAQEAQSAGR